MKRFHSIAEIREANRAAGQFFFEPHTMRFFRSKVGLELYGGRYFVTSEQGPDGVRRYSVRCALSSGHVETVGEFQAYRTMAQAKAAARALAEFDAKWGVA